jgi:glutamate formiminotransferase/formiminotetrahydrofolate cyclodeaminase
MVANLSAGKTGGMGMLPTFSTLAVTGQALKDELLYCVNEDTAAFNQVMAAFRLPKTTPTEAETRTAAIQAATRYAAEVPLRIMRTALRVLPVLQAVAETGNPQAITDAGVGAWCVLTALQGAALNVRINLASLQDADYVSHLTAEVSSLLDQGTQAHQAVMAQVMARMG